jgi:hypothetical protein
VSPGRSDPRILAAATRQGDRFEHSVVINTGR